MRIDLSTFAHCICGRKSHLKIIFVSVLQCTKHQTAVMSPVEALLPLHFAVNFPFFFHRCCQQYGNIHPFCLQCGAFRHTNCMENYNLLTRLAFHTIKQFSLAVAADRATTTHRFAFCLNIQNILPTFLLWSIYSDANAVRIQCLRGNQQV